MLQLEDLPPENAGSRFCRNNVTSSLSHTTSHAAEQKTRLILLTKIHSQLQSGPQCTVVKFSLLFWSERFLSKEPDCYIPDGYRVVGLHIDCLRVKHTSDLFSNSVTHLCTDVVCFPSARLAISILIMLCVFGTTVSSWPWPPHYRSF